MTASPESIAAKNGFGPLCLGSKDGCTPIAPSGAASSQRTGRRRVKYQLTTSSGFAPASFASTSVLEPRGVVEVARVEDDSVPRRSRRRPGASIGERTARTTSAPSAASSNAASGSPKNAMRSGRADFVGRPLRSSRPPLTRRVSCLPRCATTAPTSGTASKKPSSGSPRDRALARARSTS